MTAADDRAIQRKKGVQKNASSCDEQKRRYRESEACFAKYRRQAKPDKSGRTHSTLSPEAYRECREMKEPQCD